jgi:hypothetical protein
MGKMKTLPDYPRGLTFEDVWAALMEDRERQRETAREIREENRKMKEDTRKLMEAMNEDTRKLKEAMKENARERKERERRLDERLGKLGDRFGEMIEYMVMPGLVKKFRELGFVFTEANPGTIIDDEENHILTEIDITLQNGDKVMIVEVKSKPTTKDIKEHIKRMGIVKTRAIRRNDTRIFLGAVAGMVFKTNEKEKNNKNGFYVIEPSGEEFVVTVPEGIYSPREW